MPMVALGKGALSHERGTPEAIFLLFVATTCPTRSVVVLAAASVQRGNIWKGFQDSRMKAKAGIWP